MAEPMAPGHRRTRLAGIELPRMKIEHHRLALVRVHMVDAAANQLVRREPEIAAAADRQVDAEHARRADREFRQPREAAAADAVRKSGRGRPAVAIVQNRERARVVAESLFHQDLERPRLPGADREVRRAVADDRRPDEILEPLLRAADVEAELFGREPVDALVTIAVAGDLVALRGNLPHERRMFRRNLAEREEGAARSRAEQLQQQIDARLDAAFVTPRRMTARPILENLGVEIFLD